MREKSEIVLHCSFSVKNRHKNEVPLQGTTRLSVLGRVCSFTVWESLGAEEKLQGAS